MTTVLTKATVFALNRNWQAINARTPGRVLRPDEGNLDHVMPRSNGGKDARENLVWSAKEVNQKQADRLPHEAGLKLLSKPRAPKELPAMAFIRNSHEVEDWKLFVGDRVTGRKPKCLPSEICMNSIIKLDTINRIYDA